MIQPFLIILDGYVIIISSKYQKNRSQKEIQPFYRCGIRWAHHSNPIKVLEKPIQNEIQPFYGRGIGWVRHPNSIKVSEELIPKKKYSHSMDMVLDGYIIQIPSKYQKNRFKRKIQLFYGRGIEWVRHPNSIKISKEPISKRNIVISTSHIQVSRLILDLFKLTIVIIVSFLELGMCRHKIKASFHLNYHLGGPIPFFLPLAFTKPLKHNWYFGLQ